MSKTVKWILAAVALVAVIVIASLLYNNLSDKYADNGFDISDSHNESTTADSNSSNATSAQTSRFPLAQDFTVLDKDGKEVSLSDFIGKPVVINFWATWCFYCKEEMPDFNKSYLEHSDEVVYLMINATDGVQETKEAANAYVSENGLSFDIYYDTTGKAAEAFGVIALPSTILVNDEGRVIGKQMGLVDYKTLEEGVEILLDMAND